MKLEPEHYFGIGLFIICLIVMIQSWKMTKEINENRYIFRSPSNKIFSCKGKPIPFMEEEAKIFAANHPYYYMKEVNESEWKSCMSYFTE